MQVLANLTSVLVVTVRVPVDLVATPRLGEDGLVAGYIILTLKKCFNQQPAQSPTKSHFTDDVGR